VTRLRRRPEPLPEEWPHVVIVGGGFGGLNVARALAGQPVRVTLVDRRNYHLFQPLLYQVATAALSPAEIATPIRSILRRQRNARVLLGEATEVDLEARRLHLADGEVAYDFLVLAAGATHSYFAHPEWETLAPGLKSIEDALEIRRRLLLAYERAEKETDALRRQALLTFVIVGAGPTGVEMAGAMSEIARLTLRDDFREIDLEKTRIVLAEAGPRILPAFDPGLAEKAQRALQHLGVEVLTSTPATEVTADGVRLGDAFVAACTVVWAAGVKASPLADSLGLPLDQAGRVSVRTDLTIGEHPEVFVIGDLALTLQDGEPLPGVAQVAIQQGRFVAETIMRGIRGEPRKQFRYRDPGSLATIGRAAAIADFGWLKLSGLLAWWAWLLVHIYFLIGFQNRVLVITRWAWSYLFHHRGARLITGRIGEGPEGRREVG
jgi:NADH:quinone reductase (non-electrogenic)